MKSGIVSVWVSAAFVGFSGTAEAGPWDKPQDAVETSQIAVAQPVEVKQEVKVEAKKDVKSEAKKEAAVKAVAVPAVPTAEEEAARAQKGIDNQKAWIATLEKQLDGEKAKLAEMTGTAKRAPAGKSK